MGTKYPDALTFFNKESTTCCLQELHLSRKAKIHLNGRGGRSYSDKWHSGKSGGTHTYIRQNRTQDKKCNKEQRWKFYDKDGHFIMLNMEIL